MKIGCILLAAGAGIRFGGGKLTANINGKPVIEYVLGSLPQTRFSRRVIVAANQLLVDKASPYGFDGVINRRPELGISRSIRLGVRLMPETDACMFCVADQPLLTQETLCGMLGAYTPDTILALSCNGRSGNPVIFPSSLYSELRGLTGDESGKTVVSRHTDRFRLFPVADASQLIDIDTREDLRDMESRMGGLPGDR